MPTAEIIAIGTELLLGETTDTNTRFIAQTLRSQGVDLYRTQTIGDNVGRIAGAVGEALQRADIVITTGGLGPTVDDPTRQAIAEAVGRELEFHSELWEQIVSRIARYGRTPTENQKRQAYLPKGAIAIENPVGTAPAFILEMSSPSSPLLAQHTQREASGEEYGGRVIITLPGVPREMETLLSEAVIPYLQKRFNLHEVIRVRTLHVSGIGEGILDEQVGDLETLRNPTVGLTAHSGIVDIRIAAKAGSDSAADRMITRVEKDVRFRLGKNLFGADSETLEGIMLEALSSRGWSLACVESGLEGALLRRLAQVNHPVYRGGHSCEIRGGALANTVEEVQMEFDATVVLGIALSSLGEKQEVSITILTPLGLEERQQPYGGHPGNAARWAANNGLDWLRRIAQETGQDMPPISSRNRV